MPVKSSLHDALVQQEIDTVSDSFGAAKVPGRSPAFSISTIRDRLLDTARQYPGDQLSGLLSSLELLVEGREFSYIVDSAIRFAFLIELTNLKITSTKMKTRFHLGKYIKVLPPSYTNVEADFTPGNDARSVNFDECYEIFKKVLTDIVNDSTQRKICVELSISGKRSVAYEFPYSYLSSQASPIHTANNVRRAQSTDLLWLIGARPIMAEALNDDSLQKITTKTYLTDRAQTGADQTNRAKRWEVLSGDFQQASKEECWSVQRKLFEGLAGFNNFPVECLRKLAAKNLTSNAVALTKCPVTLELLDFNRFSSPSAHGTSDFQVGHIKPLKIGGRHVGANVAWVTSEGNRIQGDCELSVIHSLIKSIASRLP